MPAMDLDRRRAAALRPRKAACGIRDLRGFGIRVRPSGRRTWFVLVRCDGERVRRIVGDAGTVVASEARTRAAEPVAALRRGGGAPEDTVFEAAAGEALAHRARLRKPRTVGVNSRVNPPGGRDHVNLYATANARYFTEADEPIGCGRVAGMEVCHGFRVAVPCRCRDLRRAGNPRTACQWTRGCRLHK